MLNQASRSRDRTGPLSRAATALAVLVALAAIFALAPPSAHAETKIHGRDSILVLHSYNPDFVWTRSEQDGIDAVFGPLSAEYDVRTEYLDAVHHPELASGPLILNLLRAKLANHRFCVVLTSDNAAFDFARAHRAELFPGVPIVFMGVNGYKDSMLRGEKDITGVAEDTDLPGTLQVLQRLLPQTKRIVFPGMADDLTYRAIRTTVAKDLSALPPQVVAEFPEYPDVDAALDAVRTLPPDSAIVVMANMRTREGEGISSQRVVELVSAAAPVPVFTNWDFVVGQGAVGGSVISGVEQGRMAAEIALRILHGERPESIPVYRGAGKTYLFDYRQLARFDIPASRLPPEAVVLFSPERSLRISREAAWIAGVSFAALLGMTASLVLSVRRRRRTEEQVRELNQELEQRVVERTNELRQQARYLRTLVDTIPVSVWLKDTDGRYLIVNTRNPTSEKTFDTVNAIAGRPTMEDPVGKTDLELWPPDIGQAFRASDIEVMNTRQRKTQELGIPGKDGAIYWREIDKAPVIDDDGTVLGTVGVARDISERKAVEAAREEALCEAQRLAQVRSDFLAQMSHELRTPLNGILGYTQVLLQNTSLGERHMAGLAVIKQCGEQLLTLIDDILDFARIEAGKLEVRPGNIPLEKFLRTIVDIVRVRAEQKGLMFTYSVAPDLPDAIHADERILRQVLLNLLANAIKFTDSGGVSLRVTFSQPNRLRFAVDDTGIGIDADQIEAIFHPFEQAGDLRRRPGGTGLGLPISREFVRRLGGELQVDSHVGVGSSFWFELEAPTVALEIEPPAHDRIVTGYAGPRKRILVMEDVPESRALVIDMLEPLGFDLDKAADGRAGIECARAFMPDLILIDIVMPEMDGFEATRLLRETPGFERVPIIAVSASASPLDREKSLRMGASDFLPKPIHFGDLLARIAALLDLTWTYDAPVTNWQREPEPRIPLTVPPAEEMKILHHLALQGNMRDIRQHAMELRARDVRYHPFADQLRRMAEGYQSKAILGFVERHLHGDADCGPVNFDG